jgi:hypothetical protein
MTHSRFVPFCACLLLVSCGGNSVIPATPPPKAPPPSLNTGPSSGAEFLYQIGFDSDTQVSGLDPKTGELTAPIDAAPNVITENMGISPVVTPAGKFLYIQGFDQDPMTQPPVPSVNAIYCFAITGEHGQLSSLSGSPFIASNLLDPSLFIGATVTGMAMDGKGRYFYLSDFAGPDNSIRAYLIDAHSGALSNGPMLRSSSSAWYVQAFDPTNRYLYAWTMDSGTLAVSVFAIDTSTAALTEVHGSPFPLTTMNPTVEYNVAILPNASNGFVYVGVTTNNHGAEVYVFSADLSSGALTGMPGSPYAIGNAAKLLLHPSGMYLYGIDPGTTTIAVYAIDSTTGAVSSTPVTSVGAGYYGSTLIDPSGTTILSESGYNSAMTFLVNNLTGVLRTVPGSPFTVAPQWETAIAVRIP